MPIGAFLHTLSLSLSRASYTTEWPQTHYAASEHLESLLLCLHFLNAEITGVNHHTCFMKMLGIEPSASRLLDKHSSQMSYIPSLAFIFQSQLFLLWGVTAIPFPKHPTPSKRISSHITFRSGTGIWFQRSPWSGVALKCALGRGAPAG